MKTYLFIFLLAFNVSDARADWSTEIVRSLENFIRTSISQDLADQIFGEVPQVKLPPIPEVKSNAKQVESGNKRKEPKLEPKKKVKYDASYVQELYQVVIERDPSDEEFSNWMNALSQGASREGIYRALVLGDNYRPKESFDNPSNKKVINFTGQFLDTYLNYSVSKEQLSQLNSFSIKRIVVEKTLEVFDAFNLNHENLSSWYAVMSSFLAQKFQKIFKKGIRSKTDPFVHKDWAMQVPSQHIKSEIIIKLHMVFNFLAA